MVDRRVLNISIPLETFVPVQHTVCLRASVEDLFQEGMEGFRPTESEKRGFNSTLTFRIPLPRLFELQVPSSGHQHQLGEHDP